MKRALTEAVATSTAHGISRAAGTKAISLKVMWVLAFLVFMGLFLKGGINLVKKLHDAKVTQIFQQDPAPFVFPDLYLCPTNPYSGSYPFTLTKSEADDINSKITEILTRFERFIRHKFREDLMQAVNVIQAFRRDLEQAVNVIQAALPFDMSAKYLTVRIEQSVLFSRVNRNNDKKVVQFKPFYHPENIICFKLTFEDEIKQIMLSKSNFLEIWLNTDPYFPEFNFTGYPIKSMKDEELDLDFSSWHPTQVLADFVSSGFNMLIVPPGTYPSLRFESQVLLAPGNAYNVEIEMEAHACSEDLYNTHCIADHPPVLFTNPATGKPESFNYSSAACYYQRLSYWTNRSHGCLNSFLPMLWEFHDYPVCRNVSSWNESFMSNIHPIFNIDPYLGVNTVRFEAEINHYCNRKIPCTYPHYSAKYSSTKWMSNGMTDKAFRFFNKYYRGYQPALVKMAELSQQLQNGTYSTHTLGAYRSYLSEAMLSVKLSIAYPKTPQMLMTWSYSLPDFLADMGGLLGLYIGCSLLTVFELLELLYIAVEHVLKKRSTTNNALSNEESGALKATEQQAAEPI